jgi:hypothetical protein
MLFPSMASQLLLVIYNHGVPQIDALDEPVGGAGRGAGRPDSPPFRTHRAQFRQWAQDKAIHVATARELEQRMADRNLRQRISPEI